MNEIKTEQWLQQLSYDCTPSSPALFILMGMSGAGKSCVSQYLAEAFNAAWISSDTERHRQYAGREDKYSQGVTQELFEYMSELANQLLKAKYAVTIDSCALKLKERELFRQAARKNNCPVYLLYCHAPRDVLKQRIKKRLLAGSDHSEAKPELVELQTHWLELPSDSEKPALINVDTHQESWQKDLKNRLTELL